MVAPEVEDGVLGGHTPGRAFLLKRSIAFPFVAAKRVPLTADLLKSVADRNGSDIERVAVWLIEGCTVATDFCTYEMDFDSAAISLATGGETGK